MTIKKLTEKQFIKRTLEIEKVIMDALDFQCADDQVETVITSIGSTLYKTLEGLVTEYSDIARPLTISIIDLLQSLLQEQK